MVVASLVAALIAVGAFVSVPVGAVPITLQMFAVVLAALLLSSGGAFAATSVYVLLGAVGVPVFAGGKAGLAVLFGPTGGFLLGFVVGAIAGAEVRQFLHGRVPTVVADGFAAAVVIASVYLLGWAQLVVVTDMSPVAAFAAGVAPFLVFDALKAVAAVAFATAIRRARAIPAA
ncbi:MAG: biotin transporter BioY [Actinomycetota bacterium]|nr:biotin transporter BioY [Actinomycetota bacterium]